MPKNSSRKSAQFFETKISIGTSFIPGHAYLSLHVRAYVIRESPGGQRKRTKRAVKGIMKAHTDSKAQADQTCGLIFSIGRIFVKSHSHLKTNLIRPLIVHALQLWLLTLSPPETCHQNTNKRRICPGNDTSRQLKPRHRHIRVSASQTHRNTAKKPSRKHTT